MRLRIKWKILLYFLSVAFILLIFLLSNNIILKNFSKSIENSIISLTKSASKITQHYILNAQKSIIALSYLPSGVNPREYSGRMYLKRIYTKYKNFSCVLFVNERFKVINNFGEIDLPKNVLEKNIQGNSGISEIFSGRKQKSIFLYSKTNKGVYLVGVLDAIKLEEVLRKIIPYKSSFFYLADTKGNVLFFNREKAKLQDFKQRIVKRDGEKFFEVSAPVPGFSGWRIIFSAPYKTVFSGIIYSKTLGIIFILISVLASVFLAFYFSKKISQPLEELSKGAKAYAEGNLEYRINLKTGDELELLAHQFNRMAQKIFNVKKGLDEEIRAANRNLSNAYEELAKKSEQLRLQDQYKSQFLATMSHELRTPMNAIIGFTDLLKEGVYGELTEKQKETLSKIQRNSNHLLNLINDILDLSKIEAGRLELLPEKFDLRELINVISSDFEAIKKNVEFIVECPGEILLFQDLARLRQVIFNLLSNAFKFTEKGRVCLKVTPRKKVVTISVSDTGIGIKKEDMEKIFETFQQADATITRKFQGTGLGLSISKKLVEMMGGWIEVESEYGKGSVFTINIPYEMPNKSDMETRKQSDK